MAKSLKPARTLLPKRKRSTDTKQQHQTVRAYGNTSPLSTKLTEAELELQRVQEEQAQQ